MKWTSLGWVLLVFALACGDDDGVVGDAGGSETCVATCDDGLFCNGIERCDPMDPGADAAGCVGGEPPCEAACDEPGDRCLDEACPDADGDGATAVECGGTDCDDTNPNRFPGNTEVCDPDAVDEDCDPSTLGADRDGDGFDDEECCNGAECGTDCDDSRPGINPGAVDGCGGGDEDCDGDIDEEPDATFYRDQDGDNYGADDDTLVACSLPSGYAARGGDCIDDIFADPEARDFNPGVTEVCDLRDQDCDMLVDEGLTCGCTTPGMPRACGFDPALDGVGECRLGTQTCMGGMFTMCRDFDGPTAETCDGEDDDCDGTVDEGALKTCYGDGDRDGFAAPGASSVVLCVCPPGSTETNPAVSADCDDTNAAIHPGATELCNRVDDDCSGDGGVPEDRDNDGHTLPGFTACTGGFPKNDCNDTDSRAYTGQTAYFQTPHCPPPLRRCGTGCTDDPTRVCLVDATGNVPGSFDFDCNGSSTRQPSASGCGVCFVGAACAGDRPSYSGSPACGTNVTWIHCGSGGCTGGCPGARSNTTERLPCH